MKYLHIGDERNKQFLLRIYLKVVITSKCYNIRSRNSSENNGTPSGEGNITNKQKEDLEEAFNRVMDAERERRERKDNMHNDANEEGGQCGDGELDRAHAQRLISYLKAIINYRIGIFYLHYDDGGMN